MNRYPHLKPEAAEAMTLSTPERIAFAQSDFWIGYQRAQQLLAALEDLLNHPKTQRMPNLLLVGESGNGKSTIVERFRRKNPAHTIEAGNPIVPVAYVNMPSEPSESRFWSTLLQAMAIAHREADHIQRKESQAISVLRYCETRMIVIDEIHNLLYGHARQQRMFLGVLKNLSNNLQITLVAVGTRDAIRAIHTDPQLSSRFEPMSLRQWEINSEYLSLLDGFEKLLPLAKPSNLVSKEIAIKIHSMSGGIIGGIAGVVKRAAVQAIRSGKELIDIKTLNEITWTRLNDYTKAAEFV